MKQQPIAEPAENLSLFLGGPLYQFFLRTGLVKPPLDRVSWRIGIITLIAWAPLAVLTILDGRFWSGAKIPFVRDLEVQIRLLVSLPLLILAEVSIQQRVQLLIRQFRDRKIVPDALKDRYEEIIGSAQRLRNSKLAEICLLIFVLTAGGLWWRQMMGTITDSWQISVSANGPVMAPAFYWYQFVSIPITQFILLRWYFRFFIWARFLRQVSKLELNLIPTHPDRMCGLGFLDSIIFALAPFLLAHSAVFAGSIGNRILHEGARLPDFYFEIGALAAFLFLVALGPLCIFSKPLMSARFLGLQTYGRLGSEFVSGFERKWVGRDREPTDHLTGGNDIQSLADLANSFAIVRSVKPFPFGKGSIINLVVIIALPLLPLSLTMFSLQEIAMRLLSLLL